MDSAFFQNMLIMNIINKIGENHYLNFCIITILILYALRYHIEDFFDSNVIGKNANRICFKYDRYRLSDECSGIFHHITKNSDYKIKNIMEFTKNVYTAKSETQFIVGVNKKFVIDKDIYGCIYREVKEDKYEKGQEYILFTFVMYSYKYDVPYLLKKIEEYKENYYEYKKLLITNNQYIITIKNSTKNEEKLPLEITHQKWKSNVNFNNRVFPDHDNIINHIDKFINCKEWYQEKGIPYKLTFLLQGIPGCGKTSLAKAIANYTNRHIFDVKLNDSFPLEQINEIIFNDSVYKDLPIPQNKKIILFEDIDAIGECVKEREKKMFNEKDVDKNKDSNNSNSDILKKLFNEPDKKSGTTNNLSYFLNMLDGINEANGVIIIISTNHKNLLDKALIRPGRIDKEIEFTYIDRIYLIKILQNFWKKSYDYIDKFMNDIDFKMPEKLTPAKVTQECVCSLTLEDTIRKLN
jgi:SpoVK/Ycf46/Vps4 family AAA+-type ATPase